MNINLAEDKTKELDINLDIKFFKEEEEETTETSKEKQFDWQFYISYNDDLKYLSTPEKAYQHWIDSGEKENRCASEIDFYERIECQKSDLPKDFNCHDYLELNPDLQRIFGNNKYKAIAHFCQHGKNEGRLYNRKALKQENTIKAQDRYNNLSFRSASIFEKIAKKFGDELQNVAYHPIPPLNTVEACGNQNITDYINDMLFYTQDIIQQCLLERSSRILDLGCGAGKIGRGLLPYLNQKGSYLGIDVNRSAIDWCTQNITTRNANFIFKSINIANNYYYDGDNKQQNEYDFNFLDSREFDCIISIGLFNYLKPTDTVQYLQKIVKVLTQTGVAYLTFYTTNCELFIPPESAELSLNIEKAENSFWYEHRCNKYFSVYHLSWLESMLSDAGLVIVSSSSTSQEKKLGISVCETQYLVTGIKSENCYEFNRK
jgi:SAM-dependent methyltransferase